MEKSTPVPLKEMSSAVRPQKEKYSVTVNWNGEVMTHYTRAFNEAQAIRNVTAKVADIVGYTRYCVRQKLKQFEVKKIID